MHGTKIKKLVKYILRQKRFHIKVEIIKQSVSFALYEVFAGRRGFKKINKKFNYTLMSVPDYSRPIRTKLSLSSKLLVKS
jgi:hypothetical protein